jgi:NAD(P)-dependent dehydrogenase (short-subunit alcohol dehydrogenase family)
VFAINTLAPYVLTALITKPKRLVYLSSGMHHGANTNLDDLLWIKRRWNGAAAYAETKFHDVLLAFALARLFPNLLSNALEPGWVPTKMGGPGAPDDLDAAPKTQVWLATSNDRAALVSGNIFITSVSRHRIRPRTMSESSRTCWINAGRCPECPWGDSVTDDLPLTLPRAILAQGS